MHANPTVRSGSLIVRAILRAGLRYFVYLDRDMGLLSVFAARKFFDDLIAPRAVAVNGGDPKEYRNMPFRRHHETIKRELLVCGANLSTGKTVLFSWRKEHTPNSRSPTRCGSR